MPIRPEYRQYYRGPAWREIRARILARAGDRCEQCGKPNGAKISTYTWQTRDPVLGSARQYHMVWVAEGGASWRDQGGRRCSLSGARGLPRQIRVQLGVAHADNNPANMEESNLRCWCTWCHLHHDQPYHHETRSARKDAARPLIAQLEGM